MKRFALALSGTAIILCSDFSSAQSESDFVITERGAHHRVWAKVTVITNASGRVSYSTNSYTELETGMHFLRDGQWVESRAEIEFTTEGAAATNCAHPVAFAPDQAALRLTLPDGRHLRSRVLGLAYYDTSSGESVLIAQTRNSTGLLFEPNQVIYKNAFVGDSGVDADVQYVVSKAGLQQNILIHALPSSETLGLSSGSVRLQCLTEFFDPPVPELRAGSMTPDGLSDETVDFSSMTMPTGKAFAIGDADADARPVPVFKQWIVLTSGRTFLVEQIPVAAVREQLERLPASGRGAGLNPRRSGSGKSLLAALESVLPEPMETVAPPPVRMARLDSWSPRGFLLDYSVLHTDTNFTFKGDTTYYVTNTVNLSGTTVIEGGTVVKFSTNHLAEINVTGTLDCRTGQYRPAIFTVMDDNTVGETIAGSTGNPTNAYGSGLVITTSGNTLKHARFSYLYWALGLDTVSSSELYLAHVQFMKCRYPLRADQFGCFLTCGATIHLDNALAYGCDVFFQGEYGILRSRHLTVNQCNTLGSDSGNDSRLHLTNSLLVAVTNWGNIPYTTNSTPYFATDPGGIFQTVGAGAHYLADDSVYRDAGTTNLNPALRADLANRTTHGPMVFIRQGITNNLVLSPHAPRDADVPDLGYHYDPLDYAFGGVWITNATVTVTPGTALGVFSAGLGYGIGLLSGAKFISTGAPAAPNWIVRSHLVQEQANLNWTNAYSDFSVVGNWQGGSPPEVNCRFTHWSAPAAANTHFRDHSQATPLWFAHSEFHGGRLAVGYSSATLTNCLFNRVNTALADDTGIAFHLTVRNCLFRGGILGITHWEPGDFTFRDNLLDQTAVYQDGDVDGAHDGYTTGTTRLTPTNVNDVVSALVWQKGPLGYFYQPTNSPFINEGSVSDAGQVGLYQFTVTTNFVNGWQLQETNGTVDIGYHYVAMDTNGLPVDGDGDLMPDAWELAHDLNPLVNDAGDDPDGDDVTNYQEYQAGSNPHNTLVVAWGENASGQCNVPENLVDVVAVAGGEHHSLALQADGKVIAWGGNPLGETNVPVSLTNAVGISANGQSPWATSLAARSNGAVVQWGTAFGDPPADLTNAMALAAGREHCLALRSNGTVVAWGDTNDAMAQVPASLPPIRAVAAGWEYSVALATNGTPLLWGHNFWGETNMPPDLTNAIAVSAFAQHTLALRNNGTVVAWGYNDIGQTNVPAGLSNVVAVAAGGLFNLALKNDGTVVQWGQINTNAALDQIIGIGAGWKHALAIRSGRQTPVFVQQPTNVAAVTSSNVTFTTKVAALASVQYQWQSNGVNIVGATNATLTLSNVQSTYQGSYRLIACNGAGCSTSAPAVFELITPPVIVMRSLPERSWLRSQDPNTVELNVTAAAQGQWASPLKYQWKHYGTNIAHTSSSLVINSAFKDGYYSVTVTNAAGSTNVSWFVGFAFPGGIVSWGTNQFGQLDRPAEIQDVLALGAGFHHSLLVRENGTVRAWGANPHGETNVPAGLTNVVAVAGGTNHSVALKENGTVAAWGRNNHGQTNVPAGLTNVTMISASGNQTLALRSNGTVTNWGQMFGIIPASLTNAMAVAAGEDFCLALRSNGTVVAWGNNGSGQTNVPSVLTNVVGIAAGNFHALALKENGTVVAWGANGSGQANVPTGLSNVMAVAAGRAHSVALKNDGTYVCWGDNSGNQTNAPTGLPPAKYIAAGGNHTLATTFSPLVQYPVDVSKDLLLIWNTNSENSRIVKDYYLTHRPMVGAANVLGVGGTTNEMTHLVALTNEVVAPVMAWLASNPTKHPSYIILFPDLPTRVLESIPCPTTNFCALQSVAYGIHENFPGMKPFVTSINMGLCFGTDFCAAVTNDCIAYIDKLAAFSATNANKLFISANSTGYGNTNYVVDDVFYGVPSGQTQIQIATNGLMSAGVPASAIHYLRDNEPCVGVDANNNCTNWQAKPHLTNTVNVAGYICWGSHSTLEHEYAIDGKVKWTGQSSWWVIQTIESFNGQRRGGHGNFTQWFSAYAFGSTNGNYANTPVGAVSHTDEPGGPGPNSADKYFGLWAAGKPFAICAWNSKNTAKFQTVGDPFVKK